MRPDWDEYFLDIALAVSKRADCTRRAVGCVIVDTDHRIVGTGYNGAPAGTEGCLSGACPRGQKSYAEVAPLTSYATPEGLCIAAHAEANALLYAQTNCKGATAYITCKPCHGCSVLLKAAGIFRVVLPSPAPKIPDAKALALLKTSPPQGYVLPAGVEWLTLPLEGEGLGVDLDM